MTDCMQRCKNCSAADEMDALQEVTVTRAEADEARALAEAAQGSPKMQATTRFGVSPPAT